MRITCIDDLCCFKNYGVRSHISLYLKKNGYNMKTNFDSVKFIS